MDTHGAEGPWTRSVEKSILGSSLRIGWPSPGLFHPAFFTYSLNPATSNEFKRDMRHAKLHPSSSVACHICIYNGGVWKCMVGIVKETEGKN
jgi:hypothetical protein